MLRRTTLPCIMILCAMCRAIAAQEPVITLDPDTQKKLAEMHQSWSDLNKSWTDWETEQRKKLGPEFGEIRQRLGNLRLMSQSLTYLGENKLKEMQQTLVKLIQQFEASPPQNDDGKVMYREVCLQHGALCVDLAEPVLAGKSAARAWALHQELRTDKVAKSVSGQRDELATCLQLSSIWLGSDRPERSQECLQRATDASEGLKNHPLKGELFLAKSLAAHSRHAYREARDASQQALELFLKQFPHGHPKIALAQCQLAGAHLGLGEALRARELLEDAHHVLEKRQAGTMQLHAEVYGLLAHLYLERGLDQDALKSANTSRALYDNLFSKFKNSHPSFVTALSSLAELLNRYKRSGPQKMAVEFAAEAWNQCTRRVPVGPHQLRIATQLVHGKCLRDANRFPEAYASLNAALEEARRLFSASQFPNGHDLLAICQWHLGSLFRRTGQFSESLAMLRQVDASYRARYPEGHPQLAATLTDIGIVNLSLGDTRAAGEAFASALSEDQSQFRRLLGTGAEASLLKSGALRHIALSGLLSARRGIADADEQAFYWTWIGKNVATRAARARCAQLRQAEDSPQVRQYQEQLNDIASEMRQKLTHPTDAKSLRQSLVDREKIEAELRKLLPATESLGDDRDSHVVELAAELPSDAVFIEIVRYDDLTSARDDVQPATPRASQRYLAFVVASGRAVQRVELGLAAPIDQAVNAWRIAPLNRRDSKRSIEVEMNRNAEILRENVWQRIAGLVPDNVRTLILQLDGALARFPFAAMPNSQRTGILLEDYTIAYVPDGQFIREQRQAKQGGSSRQNVLVVGAVDYGAAGRFTPLSGTLAEVEAVVESEGAANSIILTGPDATTSQVKKELPAVRAAFFGTHGSFDETELNDDNENFLNSIDKWNPESNPSLPLFGYGERFPFSYVGLVLAGANEPGRNRDAGILQGEAIVNLNLEGLELAVLSACETGLGQHTAGEAVQGLQQAFHYAGCPNVVASLWKIDDAASAAIMQEYVKQLRSGRLTSLEALRQAQLTIYRNPEKWPEVFGDSSLSPVYAVSAFIHSGLGAPLPGRGEQASAFVVPFFIGICSLGSMLLVYAVWLSRPEKILFPRREESAG